MDCFRCGRRAEYDRIAVDRSSGETLGSYCTRCERTLLSRTPEQSGAPLTTCRLCGDEPDVFFPQWDTLVENDGDVEFEYTISLATPACCSGCAGRFADPSTGRDDRVATD